MKILLNALFKVLPLAIGQGDTLVRLSEKVAVIIPAQTQTTMQVPQEGIRIQVQAEIVSGNNVTPRALEQFARSRVEADLTNRGFSIRDSAILAERAQMLVFEREDKG